MVGLALRWSFFHSPFQDLFPKLSCEVQMVARVLSLLDEPVHSLIQHFSFKKKQNRLQWIVMGASYTLLGKLEPCLRFHFYPLAERKHNASPGKGEGPGHQTRRLLPDCCAALTLRVILFLWHLSVFVNNNQRLSKVQQLLQNKCSYSQNMTSSLSFSEALDTSASTRHSPGRVQMCSSVFRVSFCAWCLCVPYFCIAFLSLFLCLFQESRGL